MVGYIFNWDYDTKYMKEEFVHGGNTETIR